MYIDISQQPRIHVLAPILSGRRQVCLIGGRTSLSAIGLHSASTFVFLFCSGSPSSIPSTHEAIQGYSLCQGHCWHRACKNASIPTPGGYQPTCGKLPLKIIQQSWVVCGSEEAGLSLAPQQQNIHPEYLKISFLNNSLNIGPNSFPHKGSKSVQDAEQMSSCSTAWTLIQTNARLDYQLLFS